MEKQNCNILKFPIRTQYTNSSGRNKLRGLMKDFFKQVHPDLTPHFPTQAKELNQSSLAELNAFIDVLDGFLTTTLAESSDFEKSHELHEAFLTERRLTFFKPFRYLSGKENPYRCTPFMVTLPALLPHALPSQKEAIATRFFKDITSAVNFSATIFSDRPKPIVNPKENNKKQLGEFWQTMTADALRKVSLYHLDDKHEKQILKEKHLYQLLKRKFSQKILKTKNSKTRLAKLKKMDNKIKTIVRDRFNSIHSPPSKQFLDPTSQIAIIEAGYHPELTFFKKDLKQSEKEEGIERLKGANLTQESEVWLLNNILNVLRDSDPPIVIIIQGKDFPIQYTKFGSIQIPFNFNLWEFVEYLEIHLEEIKERRKQIFWEIQKMKD